MSQSSADEASLQPSSPSTNLQLALLKLYSADLADEELEEVRQVLARFLAQKAIRKADRVWDERGLTNEDMDVMCGNPTAFKMLKCRSDKAIDELVAVGIEDDIEVCRVTHRASPS